MMSENEPRYARTGNEPFITLGVIIVALIILAICALSVMWLRQRAEPIPTPTPEILMVDIPAAVIANNYSIRLPVILSGSISISESVTASVSASVTEQIWKVTKIKKLGYELDGRRYELAIFKRVDSEDTVKAYCINPGWDTPDIGTEYLLNAGGIFVPVNEAGAPRLQRFLMIQ